MGNQDRLKELKESIQNGTVGNGLLVFKWSDTPFVAHQYIKEIARIHGLSVESSDGFDSTYSGIDKAVFAFDDGLLRVFDCEAFKSSLVDELPKVRNAVVLCKEIDDDTKFNMQVNGAYYEIPELRDWQIYGMVTTMCPGLDDSKVKWLTSLIGKDVYTAWNEASKISCFEKGEQNKVFLDIDRDGGYSYLSNGKSYDLVNAIMSRNKQKVASAFWELDNEDINPYGLVSMLYGSAKAVSSIQLGRNATPSSTGMSEARFKAVSSREVGRYADDELRRVLRFLADYDYELLSGNYDADDSRLVDFVTCSVLTACMEERI